MGCTCLHVPNKIEFEPVVRIEENVRLLLPGGELYGRVVYLEPIEPIVINLGAVPAANPPAPASGQSRRLDEMELGEREFGQWRLVPLDRFWLQVKLPASTDRFLTRQLGGTYVSTVGPGSLREIYTHKDYVPTVIPVNKYAKPLDNARLMVYGFRYVIEVLRDRPQEYTTLPVAGYPITTS